MAALLALALVLSGVISHAGHGVAEMRNAAMAVHHTHGAAHDHHHGHDHAAHDTDLPHCCSMGACGYVPSAVPDRRVVTVETVSFQTATVKLRSIFPPLDSPPPRTMT